MVLPSSKKKISPPQAKKQPVQREMHGQVLTDPYAWLRDADWQKVLREPQHLNPEIRDYLVAENRYTEAIMEDSADLCKTLTHEMRSRIQEEDCSVPLKDGDWFYFRRYRAGGQYAIFSRKSSKEAQVPETILLDGDAIAQDCPLLSIGCVTHSPNHEFLAYALDRTGSEFYSLHIRKLPTKPGETGASDLQDLPYSLTETSGNAVWFSDSQHLLYVRLDEHSRTRWLYRHKIGDPQEKDQLLYEEKDPSFFLNLSKTQDRRYLIATLHNHSTSEVHFIDARNPEAVPQILFPREKGHRYQVEHREGTLYILTNKDAQDFRILSTPIHALASENWKEVVAHEPGRLILSISLLADHLIRREYHNAFPRIVVHSLKDGTEHTVAFDQEPHSLTLQTGYEFQTTTIRLVHSSMTTPMQIFDYEIENRERVRKKIQEIPSGHDPDAYLTQRIEVPAHDGESIPVSLLWHRDTPLDGSAPLYLYGYGAYGQILEAGFSTTRLSLVQRGFLYAIAHVRGGKEKGYAWYLQGKAQNKRNSFLDFVSVAEALIAQGYTSKGRIVAEGRSAGGLLMGAVANMAPELFLGILAGVPFVDTLNTMLDESLPLTPPEWNEWGNPIQNPEDFSYIRSYSPYDQVTAQAYPHMLVTAGLTDPRVTYWEPAKWIARLRAHNTSDSILLLRTEMEAGHSGKSGRFSALEEVAFCYAFALQIAGILQKTS